MQKLISKYALAAHLAVLAVAPLLLLPFVGERATAITMLWLSAVGLIWLLMEPSRRRGEMLHEARGRVASRMLHDPLFWLSLVMVGYAGIRAMNGGIGLAYDAELMIWSIREAELPLLPGSIDGVGLFPFAAVVTLTVIFQGTRHALGRSARAAFLFVLSVASACAALASAFALSYHHAGVLTLLTPSLFSASYFGTAYGLTLLCSLVALFKAIEYHWIKAEPLAVIGLIGNALGLTIFAPPLTFSVFAAAFLLFVIVSFALDRRQFEGFGSFRCALSILMALAAPVLYSLSVPEMSDKVTAIKTFAFFPDGFHALRDVLSGIALKTWKSNPWQGTGLGSFPLDIRFVATDSDWAVVQTMQKTTLNGWWQLLAERGVIGASLIAVALGMMLWTYFSRLIGSFRTIRFSPDHLVGIFSCLALVGLAFFDCSYLRPEVLLLTGALLSYSGGSFPERIREEEEEKD